MTKILILEDDKNLAKGIKIALEKQDYDVVLAYSYFQGVSEHLNTDFDLFILDINLPDGDGSAFCEKVRESSDAPIIFLTANDTEEDVIKGFTLGCDDYVAKPFSIEILKQRIKAVLKRGRENVSENIFVYKDLKIDFDKMQVSVSTKMKKMTATEYKLLEYLARNRGRVVTRDMILEKVWDIDSEFVDENTLSVNIRRLRQKIESDPKDPEYIITVFGIGYTFGE